MCDPGFKPNKIHRYDSDELAWREGHRVPPVSTTQSSRDNLAAAGANGLSRLIERRLGHVISPTELRFLIEVHWKDVSAYAHMIHGTLQP